MLEACFSLPSDQQRHRSTALHLDGEHAGASSAYSDKVPSYLATTCCPSLDTRKTENGKMEKNVFPALLLLLGDHLCHRAMVSVADTTAVAGQRPLSRRHLAVVVPHYTTLLDIHK